MCKKHTMANGKSTNGQIMNWKIQHRRFNIEPRTALKTNNYLQNTTQKVKHRETRTALKTNNYLQNTTQKVKDRAARTALKTNNYLQNTAQKVKKGNNKITELRTILQRESQNS